MRTARRNAIASVATAVTGIAAALIATPLIIHHIGRAGYGVWTVSMAFVIYLGIVEAGFAPTAQRFLALARGGGDERGAALVFWSTLAFYATIGLLAFVVVEALAPQIASVFRFPPRLEQDAADLLRIVGLAMPLGLLVAALANALQGFERFTAVAITSALGSLAYLGALVLLIDRDVSLAGLGWAVIVQQGVLVLTRAVLVVDVLRTRPGLVSRDDARAMASLSARLQVSVMSLIVNGQSDRVVAGIVAPPAVVGQVGIASQLAESGRMVAAAPLVPVFNRFSALHGSGDEPGLRAAFARTDRAWVVGVLGAVAVGIACAGPLVTGWLGHGYALAGAFATMLVAAYGSNILFGVRVAYLRATANAGLESRTGVVLMILNLVFTVPLAIAFGASGVVTGTLIAYLLGAVWFARRFAQTAPDAPHIQMLSLARPALLAVLFAALAGAWGHLAVGLVGPGWGLLLVAVGGALGWAGYLAAALGVRPSDLYAAARGTRTVQVP